MWLRLALIAVLIFLGVKTLLFLTRQFGRRRPEQAVEAANPAAQGASEMVRDPVCGVYIPVHEAINLDRAGRTVHFCSEECRKTFLNK